MSVMADAIHNFMQRDQYVVSTALLIWAVALSVSSSGNGLPLRDWVVLVIRAYWCINISMDSSRRC